MKKIRVLSVLIVFCLLGCKSQKEGKTLDEVVSVIGQEFQETLSDQAQLRSLVIWYHMDHERWPKKRNEIENLIAEKNAPISLIKYTSIIFEQIANDDLKVIFEKEGTYGPVEATFEVTDEEAIDESMQLKQKK